MLHSLYIFGDQAVELYDIFEDFLFSDEQSKVRLHHIICFVAEGHLTNLL